MDVPALLVFVGGFAVCAGVVFLISIFGAKEETFEEALAKQRKNNEKEKSKGKDKKKDVDKKAKNWRNKKKGEKEEKLDNMDDGEEESVVVVPSVKEPLLVEETVVETSPEPTPQPTPEPKQAKKDKKKEKKRIEIQEVDEVVEVQEVVEAPVVVEKVAEVEVVEVVEAVAAAPVAAIEDEIEQVPEPVKVVVKPSPTKQKAKKEKAASTEAGPANPKDLLSVIKKTAFNDAEAQKLIDVLLTKQSGDPLNTSEEWIEKGKPTESQKLRAELNETFQVLEEERMKCKSFSDKMTGLRRELNEEKSVKANHNRIIEELTAARAQDVNNQNNKLQQFINENTLLKGQLSQEASHRRNIEMSQNHYQATIDSLNQQLDMARAAAASASANDPHVLSELEQLRIMRDKYENTLAELSNNNSNLKAQLTQQTEEVDTVKQQLGSSAEKVSQLSTTNTSLEAALVAKSDEAQQAAADLATMKVANDKVQAAPAIPVEVEAELNTIKQKLAEKDSETSRLMEENERLSEQLASSVERPAADGEEAGNADMNGHGEAADAAEAQKIVDEDWRDKFEVLHMEHEKMLAKQKMLQIEFETELSKYQGDMESIKSKNNDLNSSLAEAKKASTALLVRLFPALPPNLELSQLEEQAKESLEDLQAVAERTPSPSKPAPVEDNSEEMEKLESQVAHYKTVLAQTESMLNSLQASVESAETEWRLKLEVANKELNDVKMQNSSLAAKASDLEASSAIAKQAEEMQVQLADLQQKLAGEEEEKTGLAKVNQELKENSEDMSQEVERLSKELTEERSEKKELSNKVTELVSANTTLQQLVGTAQEALEKENGVVKSIQDQVNSNKDKILGNQNGPSTTEAVQ
eukprot:GFUD01011106.1.p1 GENE.GFUD01011106.1~~GFUD01011106.1.p1  ORF type:complete len:866 (-),score=365.14 GFUD01011106.1:1088-3685(-)